MRRSMPTIVLALAGAAAGAALSACAPHPIVARDPVPPPAGEAYACGSRPIPLNGFTSNCVPRQPVYEERTILRSRG